MNRKLQAGIAAAVIAILAVSIVVARPGGSRQGGSTPPLTSAQDATAESGGVTLSVSSAAFSGTATFVNLTAKVADADPAKATRVSIPAEAFVAGNMAPADLSGRIMLIANAPAAAQRLRPVNATGPAKIVISFVDVDSGAGTRRITGNWALELKTPADLAKALRVEKLSGGAAAVAQGITVRPLSATRSTTETLVTVSLEGPAGVEQLALPALIGATAKDGGPVFGARIAGGEGEPQTFSFPPTDFGSPLRIQFSEFVAAPAAGNAATRWADIRLGALLERQGVTGKAGEKAAVDPADIVATSGGEPLLVTGVSFESPTVNLIAFNVTGLFPDFSGARLTLPNGSVLPPSGSGSQTGSAPTGDTGQGARSFVTFTFNSFTDLLGTVRLTFSEPGSVISDRWQVTFGE
ncbi:MAG: hypothetical protein IT301_03015 [Dehalococcoidia bacterium]|nr:hypothetical protein [Dehalococcoidia bacterium]